MNSVQTLGKWFYTGLIMLQIIFLILKFTGIEILNVNVSEWSILWLLSPVIVYAGLKYLYEISESLSNIFNWLLRISLILGFLYLCYYIITL